MENSTTFMPTDNTRSTSYGKQISIAVCCLIPVYTFSIWIFSKCCKLAKTVKFWFQHVLVSNVMSFIFFMISRLLNTDQTDPYGNVFYRLFDGWVRAGQFAGTICTFALGCEQLLSLIFAMRYQTYTNTRRLWTCAIVIYMVSFIASSTVYFGDGALNGKEDSIDTTKVAAWTSSLIIIIFSALICLVYSIVGYMAFVKKKGTPSEASVEQNDYSRFIKVMFKAVLLVATYMLFSFTPAVMDAVCLVLGKCPDIFEKVSFLKGFLRLTFYFVLPIILISSTYESRYILLMVMCRYRSKYRQQLEVKYKQRYATYELTTVSQSVAKEVKRSTQSVHPAAPLHLTSN